MDDAARNRVFRALGDPTRREILTLLAGGRRPVVEIAARFPMSRPAISKHLRLLREAGLVDEEAVGRKRLYGLLREPLGGAEEWLRGIGGAASEPSPGEAPEPAEPGRREPPRTERRTGRRRGGGRRQTPSAPAAAAEPAEEDWRSW